MVNRCWPVATSMTSLRPDQEKEWPCTRRTGRPSIVLTSKLSPESDMIFSLSTSVSGRGDMKRGNRPTGVGGGARWTAMAMWGGMEGG